jgi:ATP-dependent helicase HrpB
LIQPRVLATQALAQRLAQLLGEPLGQRVGYQVPYGGCQSAATQLVLMTPGILLQHLLQNPELNGVGCVMLDEIHERSVNQDLAWALLQEVQILRDNLQLVLMSATPDPSLQQQISQRLFTPGRCFPVTTSYLPAKQSANQLPERLEQHFQRALAANPQWHTETCLVFLPGWRAIEDCAALLRSHYPQHKVFRLHSRVAMAEQAAALDVTEGPRMILATNIAETSLTIADVTLVIDAGLARRADYEQRAGVTRLRTARISQASAEQRRGRAGRVQAGRCVRLWSQDQPLAAAELPEIRATDYLPLALRIAHWGSPWLDLPWLEAPNKLAFGLAQQQLQRMGLLDESLQITAQGRKVSALGTDPRIAALLLQQAPSMSEPVLLLALALHFDLNAASDLDELLALARQELGRNKQWQQQQKRWLLVLDLKVQPAELDALGLARAFGERIGYRQESGRYRLNSGISVAAQPSLNSPWAVFPWVEPRPKGYTGLGAALNLTQAQQRQLSSESRQLVFKAKQWQWQCLWQMGGVVIDEQLQALAATEIAPRLSEYLQTLAIAKGLEALQWPEAALRQLAAARLVQTHELLMSLPDLREAALVASLPEWLAPFLQPNSALEQLPLQEGLAFYLGYDNCQRIAQLLPEKIDLPSGRSVHLEFSAEGNPQISAKLQEFFGCEQLQLGDGRLPLKIHLLAPNGSSLAITTNLQTFWQQGYPDVRRDMRGRYPRHPWPENPFEHEATALTKRKLAMLPKE